MQEELDQRLEVEPQGEAADPLDGATWRAEARDRQGAMGRASLSRVIAMFAGGNAMAMGLGMVGGILSARVVAPATLGLFNGYSLVLGYIPFLTVGAFNGLRRELPYFIGRQDRTRAASVAAAAQGWALVLAAVTAAVLLGLAGLAVLRGDRTGAAGWATQAVSAFLLFYATDYLSSTFRSKGDFVRLSTVSVVQAALGVLGVGAAWWLGFPGLCLRHLMVVLGGAALLWVWRPISVAPTLDRGELRHLFKIGLPIFMVGQLYAWWTVLNQTLILKMTGAHGLGLYSLATMSLAAMSLLPLAVTQVTYPRIVEMYGRKEAIAPLVRYLVRPAVLLALAMVPLVAVAWLALPVAARLVLPKYVDGVSAAQWIMICAFLLSLQPLNNVFITAKRQGLYLVAIVSGMAANGLALVWLLRGGTTLVAFPQALAFGRLVFQGLCWFFLARLVRAERSLCPASPRS